MDTPIHYGRIFGALKGVKKQAADWKANCPAHQDKDRSLNVKIGADGKLLVKCHAGCSFNDIRNALSLEVRDFFPPEAQQQQRQRYNQRPHQRQPQRSERRMAEAGHYDYRDEDGTILYQTVRKQPKGFFQRRPAAPDDDPSAVRNGWVNSLGENMRRVLYRLPELLEADPKRRVHIPEGEKDVDRLRSLGMIATCNVGGAGKWRTGGENYIAPLRGRHVIVIPDNDAQAMNGKDELLWHEDGRPKRAGWDHACDVCETLMGQAASVSMLILPGVPLKGDTSDWLDANGNSAQSWAAMAKAIAYPWDGNLWHPADRKGGSAVPPDRTRPGQQRNLPEGPNVSAEGQEYIRAARAIMERANRMNEPDFTLVCRSIMEEARANAERHRNK